MSPTTEETPSKVPEVTPGFWIIKVAATILGKTGGGAIVFSAVLGLMARSLAFPLLFCILALTTCQSRR